MSRSLETTSLDGIVIGITIIGALLQLRLSVGSGSGDGRLLHQVRRLGLLLGDVLHRLHELLLVVLLLLAVARRLLLEGQSVSLLHWLLDGSQRLTHHGLAVFGQRVLLL